MSGHVIRGGTSRRSHLVGYVVVVWGETPNHKYFAVVGMGKDRDAALAAKYPTYKRFNDKPALLRYLSLVLQRNVPYEYPSDISANASELVAGLDTAGSGGKVASQSNFLDLLD